MSVIEPELKEEQVKSLTVIISSLITQLKDLITKYCTNKITDIQLERLMIAKDFLTWMIKKYKIMYKGTPEFVYKRDIFYCEFGFNIGSEKCGKRPVVILQNDTGNKNAENTIVAPITTNSGTANPKPRYYKIPIKLEEGYKEEVVGCVDVGHIRTISKKRLGNFPIAKINLETQKEIDNAIKMILAIPT